MSGSIRFAIVLALAFTASVGVAQAARPAAPDLIERKVALLQATTAPASAVALGAGFQWRDAGIGAGTSLVLVLTVGAALLALRRHRDVAH
jgi:hypothetical protein